MGAENTKRISTDIWVFILVLVIIVTGFIAFNAGKNSQPAVAPTTVKVDNSQALRDCIAQNVTPLQANGGGYNVPKEEQIALDSCKAQYPTN